MHTYNPLYEIESVQHTPHSGYSCIKCVSGKLGGNSDRINISGVCIYPIHLHLQHLVDTLFGSFLIYYYFLSVYLVIFSFFCHISLIIRDVACVPVSLKEGGVLSMSV